jgi:hypothetical protein
MAAHPGARGPWALLAVLTFARVAYGVQFQSVGAVGPAMVAELGLDYASLGTLVGAYSVLGLALSLPAGWLIARLGDRRVVLAGLGLIAAGGLLLAVAPGFGVALAGRLVSGAGAVLLLVALPTIVAGRFAGAALWPRARGPAGRHRDGARHGVGPDRGPAGGGARARAPGGGDGPVLDDLLRADDAAAAPGRGGARPDRRRAAPIGTAAVFTALGLVALAGYAGLRRPAVGAADAR